MLSAFLSADRITGPYTGGTGTNISIFVPGTTSLPVWPFHRFTTELEVPPCNGNPSFPQYYNTGPVPFFVFPLSDQMLVMEVEHLLMFDQNRGCSCLRRITLNPAICDGQIGFFDLVHLKVKSLNSGESPRANPAPSYNPFG
ncbi:MAG: hypothetical protein R2813_00485 [Flavobacteriales bacterium]